MQVPTIPPDKPIDESGNFTDGWNAFFQQLVQAMQQSVSNEGFLNPSQSQANIAILEPTSMAGTVLFNTDEVNGGSMGAPNGQLFVRLADGTYHAIPNL